MNKFYLSTSIPYINGVPHVGHALEFVQADFLARFYRLRQKEVFFQIGTDEHGLKIAEVAKEKKLSPQELADLNSAEFRRLAVGLQMNYDNFWRTTDQKHKKQAQQLWLEMKANGDLEKRKYQGDYCVGCEKFLTEKEIVQGKCELHPQMQIRQVSEENYFFTLTKYKNALIEAIQSKQMLIYPEYKVAEVLNMLEDLTDVSFSRAREAYQWGIEVPGEPEQLMYVWPDALSNYYTGLSNKDLWPADLHCIGKDIVKFHAIFWPAILLSLRLPLPKALMVHGFVTAEGQKMSKSLSNVVDPFVYLEKYGAAALRYYLLKEIPTLDDGDFSAERFQTLYTEELSNKIGNLMNRVAAMMSKYLAGEVTVAPAEMLTKIAVDGENLAWWVESVKTEMEQAVAVLNIKLALEKALILADLGNKVVEQEKPWDLAKKGDFDRIAEVLLAILELLKELAWCLWPAMPDKAEQIAVNLGVLSGDFQAADWQKVVEAKWQIAVGTKISSQGVLFARVE